jgi:hypothetical protein
MTGAETLNGANLFLKQDTRTKPASHGLQLNIRRVYTSICERGDGRQNEVGLQGLEGMV